MDYETLNSTSKDHDMGRVDSKAARMGSNVVAEAEAEAAAEKNRSQLKRRSSEETEARAAAHTRSIWSALVKNLWSSSSSPSSSSVNGDLVESKYLRNLAVDKHFYNADGSLPDPLLTPELCHIPDMVRTAVDRSRPAKHTKPLLRYCDPDSLISASSSQVEPLVELLEAVRVPTLIPGCGLSKLSFALGFAGPSLPVTFDKALANTYTKWAIDPAGCGDAALMLVRLQSDGTVTLKAHVGVAAQRRMSADVIARIGQEVSVNAKKIPVETRAMWAALQGVQLVKLQAQQVVRAPRQQAQLYALCAIFLTVALTFPVLFIILTRVSSQRAKEAGQRRRARKAKAAFLARAGFEMTEEGGEEEVSLLGPHHNQPQDNQPQGKQLSPGNQDDQEGAGENPSTEGGRLLEEDIINTDEAEAPVAEEPGAEEPGVEGASHGRNRRRPHEGQEQAQEQVQEDIEDGEFVEEPRNDEDGETYYDASAGSTWHPASDGGG